MHKTREHLWRVFPAKIQTRHSLFKFYHALFNLDIHYSISFHSFFNRDIRYSRRRHSFFKVDICCSKSTFVFQTVRVHNNFTLFTSLVQVPKIIHEIMRSQLQYNEPEMTATGQMAAINLVSKYFVSRR